MRGTPLKETVGRETRRQNEAQELCVKHALKHTDLGLKSL